MEIKNITIQLNHEDLESLSKKELLKTVREKLFGSERDFTGYLRDVLYRDETRMVMSKESLTGYHDTDIELNRNLQMELKKYINERD